MVREFVEAITYSVRSALSMVPPHSIPSGPSRDEPCSDRGEVGLGRSPLVLVLARLQRDCSFGGNIMSQLAKFPANALEDVE